MRPDFEKSEGDWHASVFWLSLIYEWVWCLGIDRCWSASSSEGCHTSLLASLSPVAEFVGAVGFKRLIIRLIG